MYPVEKRDGGGTSTAVIVKLFKWSKRVKRIMM